MSETSDSRGLSGVIVTNELHLPVAAPEAMPERDCWCIHKILMSIVVNEGHESLDVPRRPVSRPLPLGRNRLGQILEPPKARKDTEKDELLHAEESCAIRGAIFEVYREVGR